MIEQTYSFLGPQLAFILALPLAEWVTTCIAIDEDDALRVAVRPPTATEAVADAFEQAHGAATTELLSTSTAEAVVRGAEGRRQLLAWPILSIYTYNEGVAMEGPIITHVGLALVLATLISVWQEWESLDYLFLKSMITFNGTNPTGKALSWFMGGSRETVARNADGHPVHRNVVLQPGIHLLAYGASGLLTSMALFLHPGSFFLLLPMLFLTFTGGPGYRRLYAVDHSLRGMLLGSCTILSMMALGFPLLVWMVRAFTRLQSENGDGNDVSGQLSDFDRYAIFISTQVMMIFLHSVLISALARLEIALARTKAARRLLSVDPAPSTPFYNTLPPLKETPFGGGPTGPRLVVPGLTSSSFRLGLYTMVGLLSTTLLVVAVPILCWMFFTNVIRSGASIASFQYAAALFSPLVFTPLVYLAALCRGEFRAVWKHCEPLGILKQDKEEDVAGASTSRLQDKAGVGLLSGGKDNVE